MTAASDYYARHTPITDPGQYAMLLDGLPHDLPALHQIVQNVLIHIWKIRKYHPKWLSRGAQELGTRRVSKMLALIQAHTPQPLTVERPRERKVIIDCRSFATLLCAILRHQGVPARVRVGFATYLEATHYQDHWLCEYWNGERWLLEDPDLVKHDVSHEEFIIAGKAWQMARSGQTNPHRFGFSPDMRGLWAVRHSLVRDLAALNGFEPLTGDEWGLLTQDGIGVSDASLPLLDQAAAWTLADNSRFDEMRAFYENAESLRVTEKIRYYNYIRRQSEAVDLKAEA